MEGIVVIIIGIGLSVLVGKLGEKRKIGFWGSFIISIVLSPVIGLIATLFSKKKDVEFVDINRKQEKSKIKDKFENDEWKDVKSLN